MKLEKTDEMLCQGKHQVAKQKNAAQIEKIMSPGVDTERNDAQWNYLILVRLACVSTEKQQTIVLECNEHTFAP